MNETIQLLQDVSRNARSGEEAVNDLMGRVESQEMRGELDRERRQYQQHAREAESALAAAGESRFCAGIAVRVEWRT